MGDMTEFNETISEQPYWEAKLKDGTTVNETSTLWTDVSSDVVSLRLNVDGRWHELPPGMEEYMQAKTVSSVVGSRSINIESRYIGFRHGNHEYYLRVNEQTRSVSIEIKEVVK
jgi:hypothetical protein